MPVMWRETDFDVRFLLYDIYSTEHDALDEGVHGEPLRLCSLEHGMLHPVCNDERCRIEEEAEVVCAV